MDPLIYLGGSAAAHKRWIEPFLRARFIPYTNNPSDRPRAKFAIYLLTQYANDQSAFQAAEDIASGKRVSLLIQQIPADSELWPENAINLFNAYRRGLAALAQENGCPVYETIEALVAELQANTPEYADEAEAIEDLLNGV